MKRKFYPTYLFYWISGIIALMMPFGLSVFMIYVIGNDENNQSIIYDFLILFISASTFVFFIIIMGKKMFQWIIIDENHITAKCIYGTIKKIKWDDLKDIVFERFDIGSPGIKSGWFVFVEEGKRLYQKNGVITKDSYITLKSNRKTLETIKCYWNKKIINLID